MSGRRAGKRYTAPGMQVVERNPVVHVKPALQRRAQRVPHFHVVLLDSDTHTYEYVIVMLRMLFAHPTNRAFELAKAVDKRGAAIVFTAHRELAELKLEQIHGFGADPLSSDCTGPMRAVLRPVDDTNDDD